ncbi:hypothetical protein SK128_013772 [Halocaridina rubra]|uniref:glutathione transferase n=1 Tax=Halocaridina rubra TaxID=373956 RepID=A0AAN8WHK4_HALRR
MPEYKLIYFNARGRAELTRWLFAYGGVNYVDERITREEWPDKKPNIPGGRVPVLMIGDKPLPQSLAIARYVAKEVGLVPEDNLKAAYCDALADTLAEMMGKVYEVMMSSKTEEEKNQLFKDEVYPKAMVPVLTRLQKRLSENEWFAGDKISWSDIMISLVFGEIHKKKTEFIDPFPAVMGIVNKVRALPKIKDWIAKAPETQF